MHETSSQFWDKYWSNGRTEWDRLFNDLHQGMLDIPAGTPEETAQATALVLHKFKVWFIQS